MLPEALGLAKSDDRVGWRQLEQQLRRVFPERVKQWRQEHERAQIKTKDELFPIVDELLQPVLGRMVFSLAGVLSQKHAFEDQRRAIDDLISVPDWNGSGLTIVVDALRGMVFLFQYLHGTLCLDLGRADLAIGLAQTPLPRRSRSDDQEPIWRHHDITGWPKLLGGDCRHAWEYLRRLPETFPVLNDVFGLRRDYEINLAAYSMLLSLLEAAHDATRLLKMTEEEKNKIGELDVPPMFADMPFDISQAAFRRVFGSTEVVRLVAERSRVDVGKLHELWPYWKMALQRFHRGIHRDRFFADDLPLGDLG